MFGSPMRRLPETCAQGLRRKSIQCHTRKVIVNAEHRDTARVKWRYRLEKGHTGRSLTGKKNRSEERLF